MISWMVITIIRSINKASPIKLQIVSTLEFTGLPLIFSMIINKTCPPSKAGNGSILINPTLIDKNAVI